MTSNFDQWDFLACVTNSDKDKVVGCYQELFKFSRSRYCPTALVLPLEVFVTFVGRFLALTPSEQQEILRILENSGDKDF